VNETPAQPDYSNLRGNVSLLGRLLGETIAAAEGDDFLELIEDIRGLSKQGREAGGLSREPLLAILRELKNEQLVPVARAFSQFLNLSNIADQQHTVSRHMDPLLSASRGGPSRTSGGRCLHGGSHRGDQPAENRVGVDRPPDGDHPPHPDPQAQ
jgi:phosphoenolpyruvate carboxylase